MESKVIFANFRKRMEGRSQMPLRRTERGRTSTEADLSTLISRNESEPDKREIWPERDSQPVKDPEDIRRISEFYKSNGRWRDNMLFLLGINFGLRISDLLELKFCDLIDGQSMQFRGEVAVFERKTRNTRKRKGNRHIAINRAARQAVEGYLRHAERKPGLDWYLFRSESGNGKYVNLPIHRNTADRILKDAARGLNLGIRMGTHTLRKTFGYHQMRVSGHDPRRLLLLQKMFGHRTMAQTLAYIGITDEEMAGAYLDLDLGMEPDPEEIGAGVA